MLLNLQSFYFPKKSAMRIANEHQYVFTRFGNSVQDGSTKKEKKLFLSSYFLFQIITDKASILDI
ncbi:hypothetical protein JCM31447_28700 [Fluviispira sanaruensis]|uniref:Uncharacterized protein n=1 Tax=Fluviispira sanaruensis TaxID=2493639 RepID=A0A4P2VXM7_FLUSA|nr:hypothetical protein JCM31447_28700 [Fluviispira sanaruensis]